MVSGIGVKLRIGKMLAALSHLPRAIALVWGATRVWTAAWAALLLIQGLLPAATVYLTRPLIDSLVAAVNSGVAADPVNALRPVLWWGGLMAALMLLSEALHEASGLVRKYQSELLQDHIAGLVYRQSIAADYAFYDLPEFYDHLHRARTDAVYRPEMLLESIGGLAQSLVTLLAIGAVIVSFGWWLPVILVMSALPALLVLLYWTLRQFDWQKRVTEDERRIWYYDWMLTSSETAAEVRLFDLGEHFQSAWGRLRTRLRNERLQLARKQSRAELGASTLALIVTICALGWMVWQAVQGVITMGVLALFYQALNQGQQLMRSLLDNAGQLYSNSLFLGNLFEFLALKPCVTDPVEPLPAPARLSEGVRFDRVSFSYPGNESENDRHVLSDFSLEIPAGTIVAIVGLNGAGKSTLFKLLCRLYDVDSGKITVDGVDLREMKIRDLRRMITVLFQSPVRYSQTAAENIAFGDLTSPPSNDEIESAAIAAGAGEIIAKLPGGYQHQLGKWFGNGTDLSVGEWQRIALARAFLRQAPIILLDEPTSAMDSWTEAEWMQRFRALAEGRTAIIITHRFTTAMQADIIHVMVDGEIVESGAHSQLVARGGYYAQSWTAQMKEVVGQ
ncbi:MAG: Vitamin B12 import ATP-binding protein BtuD [Acidobacteria bacterium]|nr:Vitamin B12 import ATP-binding protein BtuD [Acidobacteriota bacterium]